MWPPSFRAMDGQGKSCALSIGQCDRRSARSLGQRLRRASDSAITGSNANKPRTRVSDLLTPPTRAGAARPVLVAGFAEAAWLGADGGVDRLDPTTAARRALIEVPIVCHAPATFRRLKSQR